MDFSFTLKGFSLYNTLYSGQCFRFKEIDKNKFLIFSGCNSCYVRQEGEELFFKESSCDEFFWKEYFNYSFDFIGKLKKFEGDKVLEKLIGCCPGIYILKQEPFETLISFILSTNNNIKRIQKIIETLCENFGEKIKNGYSFPKIEFLKKCSEKDFDILKAGFRTKYLVDAIEKVYTKKVDLNKLYSLSFEEAKKKLKRIYGVAEKVSSCVLLFAYNKMESFPVDVWIKKVIDEYYKEGLTKQVLSCKGLAQQLLFYGKRNGFI